MSVDYPDGWVKRPTELRGMIRPYAQEWIEKDTLYRLVKGIFPDETTENPDGVQLERPGYLLKLF